MLDLDLLASELDFDRDDVVMLLEMFLEGAQVSLANMEEAIETNDITAISQEAHAIKGSAANMMLADIVDVANELEISAKQNKKINYLSLYTKLESMVEELGAISFETA
jgi:HPt (histidine-containing phosphotransfer) domain-containing protein